MISQFFQRSVLPTVCLSAALLVTAGCDSGPAISPVTGTVTLDGEPYPSAQVRFVTASGRPAMGLTDESGNYTLVYMRDQRGALPGDYKVDITTVHVSTSDSDGGREPPEKLPAKYNRLTELKATVVDGPNTIDFDLTSR